MAVEDAGRKLLGEVEMGSLDQVELLISRLDFANMV
jgi:hypothetical protein